MYEKDFVTVIMNSNVVCMATYNLYDSELLVKFELSCIWTKNNPCVYVKYSKEPTDRSASPSPRSSCPLQHCMQLVMGSHFLDTKCHVSCPQYWHLGCVRVFICVHGLVLMDLAVLFTAHKGSLTSAPVAKRGHFKVKSASASHS